MSEQKSEFETFYQSDLLLTGPVTFNRDGEILVCCIDGNVLNIAENGEASVWLETGGAPQCIAFDGDGTANICDQASKSILTYNSNENQLTKVVDTYEERPLNGPNCIVVDDDQAVFFTDSGSFGECSLPRPSGSLYYIGGQERLLQPLLDNCLAHPYGVCVAGVGAGKRVFVAETLTNRILRGCQTSKGVYHFSVFHQFSGGMGPTGICVDASGNLYVARHDFGYEGAQGCITILSARGKVVGEVDTPAANVTGVALGPDSSPYLYVTEADTKSIYRIALSALPGK